MRTTTIPSASRRHRLRAATIAAVAALGATVAAPAFASAAPPRPANDPFYAYTDETPLAEVAPGTVLKSRTRPFRVSGITTPITAVQLLYRSTGFKGQPTTNVTSVLLPPFKTKTPRVFSYQSFYDSLNPDDQPSYAVSGGTTLGGAVNTVEAALFAPWLLQGYIVNLPDTQGQQADFAAGPVYGYNTLDSLRAAFSSKVLNLPSATKAGLFGYSGGAIATGWAAELAPGYAPDVDGRLVGAALGGLLVSPAHNLRYVEGSSFWAGVMPMAIIGAARSYGVDITPYLSAYGMKVYHRMKKASIAEVLGAYPGLKWTQLAKPEYPTPESVDVYVEIVNQLIMGTYGTPTTPLYIAQGAKGELEGTKGNKPGIGPGDGVMIAGDVRTLAREYCAEGTKVVYKQFNQASHIGAAVQFLGPATSWLQARFRGAAAPENCATIAEGNSLAPIPTGASGDDR